MRDIVIGDELGKTDRWMARMQVASGTNHNSHAAEDREMSVLRRENEVLKRGVRRLTEELLLANSGRVPASPSPSQAGADLARRCWHFQVSSLALRALIDTFEVNASARKRRAHQPCAADLLPRYLIQASSLFDPARYLAENVDVAQSGMDPLDHYLRFGGVEGRRPGPNFDGARYLAEFPDVAAAGVNPLLHYIEYGSIEGRDQGCVSETLPVPVRPA